MYHRFLGYLIIIGSTLTLLSYKFSQNNESIDPNTQKVSITVQLEPDEYLYKDSLLPSVNNPEVVLSDIKAHEPSTTFFDPFFKANKEGYKGNVTLTLEAQRKSSSVKDATIHLHFSTSKISQPQEKTIHVIFDKDTTAAQPHSSSLVDEHGNKTKPFSNPNTIPCDVPQPSFLGNFMQRSISYISATITTWRNALTSLFTATGSHAIRIIAALILGVLLSLTPCIYPMIPITVGILQANTSGSALRNFLLAFSYTLGISLTFALLGFIAAVGSCVFGQLQGSPWTIVPLAAILFYFGGSMFGFYEMYIPRFLQPKNTKFKGGSFISAFLFGIISGTVASPCLSPGLALILNYVGNLSTAGTIAGYLEGFILLFVFGIGSSLPLLIIGTFSSSVNLLPQAGMWMVEIKKLFGIMLIGMGFYHLSHLERYFPWYILVWVIVASLVALGVYYFASVKSYDSKWAKLYKNIVGTIFIILACIMGLQGYKAWINHRNPVREESFWLRHYKEAREQAINEHKNLFIDIGATYCGACKALDKNIFQKPEIQQTLKKSFIPVKIESDVDVDDFDIVNKLYNGAIKGFPTYLVVEPKSEKLIKKWGTDIEDLSLPAIVKEFELYKD